MRTVLQDLGVQRSAQRSQRAEEGSAHSSGRGAASHQREQPLDTLLQVVWLLGAGASSSMVVLEQQRLVGGGG